MRRLTLRTPELEAQMSRWAVSKGSSNGQRAESHSHSQASLRSVVSAKKYSTFSLMTCPTPDVFVARSSKSIPSHPFDAMSPIRSRHILAWSYRVAYLGSRRLHMARLEREIVDSIAIVHQRLTLMGVLILLPEPTYTRIKRTHAHLNAAKTLDTYRSKVRDRGRR